MGPACPIKLSDHTGTARLVPTQHGVIVPDRILLDLAWGINSTNGIKDFRGKKVLEVFLYFDYKFIYFYFINTNHHNRNNVIIMVRLIASMGISFMSGSVTAQ